MSIVLEKKPPVKTIFGFASVRDEKGEEMHKSKGNAVWFDEAASKVGVDPMRWMYAKQNPAENLKFGYKAIDEIKRRLLTLYNVYTFFSTYVKKEDITEDILETKSERVLDKWIVSRMDHLIGTSEFNLEKYDVARVVLAIEDFFINDLSLWYVRRSRKRFHEDSPDRKEAIATVYYILLNTVKLISPVMPFFAEEIYQNLKTDNMPESVHLCDWPKVDEHNQTDLELEAQMDEARFIVNLSLAQRSEKQIKVRQPISSIKIKNLESKIKDSDELLNLVKEEVNAKEILFDDKISGDIEIDTVLTKELKEEGAVRDIVRCVQEMRKTIGLTPENKITVSYSGDKTLCEILEKNKEFVLKETRAKDLILDKDLNSLFDSEDEILIEDKKLLLKIKK